MIGRLGNTTLVVDNFTLPPAGVSFQPLFFLTHAHADHLTGLRPGWAVGRLFCSAVTKALIVSRFKLEPAYVTALPLDVPHVLYLDDAETLSVRVTFMDANHCPGAIMILFEGSFGTYLHTGDCRFQSSMARHPALIGKHINCLYLDNTFFSPQYTAFPTYPSAIDAAIALIRRHPFQNIVLPLDFLGKEKFLYEIGLALGEKIAINEAQYETLPLLGMPELVSSSVFTTDLRKARIRVESKSVSHKAHALAPNTIVLRASAQAYPRQDIHPQYHVNLPLHSSYDELMDCMRLLRPDFVYPTSVGTRDPASHVYKVANSMLQSALKSIQRSAPDGSDCSEAAPDGSDGDELEDIWSPEPVSSSAAAADGDSLRPPRRVPPALFKPELTRADHLRLVRRKKIAKKALRPVTLLQSRVRMRQERPRFDVDEDDAAVLPSSPLAVVQSSTTAAVTNTSEDELDEATLKLGCPSTPDDEGFAALMHCLSDEEEEVGEEDRAPEVPSVLTVVASEDKNPRKRKIGKSSNRLAEWMEGWANS